VSDEQLMTVLRRKVKLNQPYAGVFVKRDDENAAEVVHSVDQLYPVGSFVQVRRRSLFVGPGFIRRSFI
jgi:Lon-like ATP-dependent protease